MILENAPLAAADVFLLSEVDRGCRRSGELNLARELAMALKMNFVFAVEFIERRGGPIHAGRAQSCELGNAILSRFPLENPGMLIHEKSDARLPGPFLQKTRSQSRIGGRILLQADLRIGRGLPPVRVYSLHFSSGMEDGRVRNLQAAEVVVDAGSFVGPVIAGGDLNAALYLPGLADPAHLETSIRTFEQAGFQDAHRALPAEERPTFPLEDGPGLVLDLILYRGLSLRSSGVCREARCRTASDHLPIHASLELP